MIPSATDTVATPTGTLCESCRFIASDQEQQYCMITVTDPIRLDQQFEDCPEYLKREGEMLTLMQYQALTPDQITELGRYQPMKKTQETAE